MLSPGPRRRDRLLARMNSRLTQDFGERDIAIVARLLNAILERF
jgi:hypothetical protein